MKKEFEIVKSDINEYEIYEVNGNFCYFYGTEYECEKWLKNHS